MSAKRTQKNKVGRPATGITKSRPSITMDKKLEKAGRKIASSLGITFSAWVEQSVRQNLAAVVAEMEAAP